MDSDTVALYSRSQYDNGVAAGAPPDFDGAAYGVKPRPSGESRAGGVTLLPRLGGGPILTDATPRAPLAPGGPGITTYAPKVPEDARPVLVAAPGSPQPILRAAPDQADTPTPATALGARSVLDWRLAFLVTLGALVFFALIRDDK